MSLDHKLLPVLEEFVSIQGEGRNIGRLYYFIRVGGCPLRCNFCDSEYTWKAGKENLTLIDNVVEKALEVCRTHGIDWVSVTGGEPLLYPQQMCSIIERLAIMSDGKIKVHIETSGRFYSKEVHDMCELYSPDVKTPCTGEQSEHYLKWITKMRQRDQVKCLISDENDLEYANRINRLLNGRCPMILQPFNLEIHTDSTKNMTDAMVRSRNTPDMPQNNTVLRRALAVGLQNLVEKFKRRCSDGEVWLDTIITPQIHVLAFGNTPAT